MTHLRCVVASLAVAALTATAFAAAPVAPHGRFLYVVGCGAQLTKVDTLQGRKVGSVDLSKQSGGARIIPEVHGVLDGCLTDQAVYDPIGARFYTLVPRQAESKPDGTKDYVVLGFSIPAIHLVQQTPAGDSLADPPHLDLDRARHVAPVDASAWSPTTTLDLQGFVSDGPSPRNQILETSGHRVLLRVFSANEDQLTIAVADLSAKTLTYLHGFPSTTARNVHLAPGGQAVLVEEVASTEGRADKTGRLVLFELVTGRATSTIVAPLIAGMAFLAISPNGKAIYHQNDAYRLLSMGRQFSQDPVSRPSAEGYPGLFFADR